MTKEERKLYESIMANVAKNVKKTLNEASEEELAELEEGFLDNAKQGAKAFFGKGDFGAKANADARQGGGLNLDKRWNAAKVNYNMKDEYDKIKTVIDFLVDRVNDKDLDPDMTIKDLIGGPNTDGKFGTKFGVLSGMLNNRASRGSRAQNNIYK